MLGAPPRDHCVRLDAPAEAMTGAPDLLSFEATAEKLQAAAR
jgi:hypothetical protein